MDGQLWRTVMKVASDSSETYLVSLRKACPWDLRAARGSLGKIARETD